MLERSFIYSNIKNPRNYGMSENHSAKSLQNSVNAQSFTKSDRFAFTYKKPIVDNYYQVNDLYSKRSTSLGYGNKIDFRFLVKNCSPSPNTYNLPSTLRKGSVSIKGRDYMPVSTTSSYPGPGEYPIVEKNTSLPTTLKFRHGFYYDEDYKYRGFQLSPNAYFPDDSFTVRSRYKNIKFGIEPRIANDIPKGIKMNPGPGTYDLPSVFDLSRKYKIPIN